MDAYFDLEAACSEASDRDGSIYLHHTGERYPIRAARFNRVTSLELPFSDMFLQRVNSISVTKPKLLVCIYLHAFVGLGSPSSICPYCYPSVVYFAS